MPIEVTSRCPNRREESKKQHWGVGEECQFLSRSFPSYRPPPPRGLVSCTGVQGLPSSPPVGHLPAAYRPPVDVMVHLQIARSNAPGSIHLAKSPLSRDPSPRNLPSSSRPHRRPPPPLLPVGTSQRLAFRITLTIRMRTVD